MELVRGVKITEFCDKNNLTTRERLNLFIQVCQAIQHAHQKGIIHRDIKPSNILVTLNDGVPMPKVIDFGIAKATQQRLTDKTLFTAFEQFLGTPAYMSPEQAEMNAQGVDTRSDIYSLGVLLYELLTGQTPFATEKLLAAGVNEIRRIIREEEPVRPSTKLSTMLAGDLTATANHRQTLPPKLVHTVRGELDWIVMKALEKDRNRRYETANGFARDVERYLADEPVAACPPSKIYRLGKTIRSHKFAFTLASSVLVTLMIGLAVSSHLYVREKQAKEVATLARKKAESEAARSEQVTHLLKDMLKGVSPSVALGRDTTMLREILEQATEKVNRDLVKQQDIQADMLQTIGEIFSNLGDEGKAEQYFREVIAIKLKLTAQRSADLVGPMNDLGFALNSQGKIEEAAATFREAYKLGHIRDEDDTLSQAYSLDGLSHTLKTQGLYSEAEKTQRRAIALNGKLGGTTNGDPLEFALTLADILMAEGKYTEAEPLYLNALAILEKDSQTNGPAYGGALAALGRILIKEKKYADAEPVFRKSISISRNLHVKGLADLASAYLGLVNALMIQNRRADAERVFDGLSESDLNTTALLEARSLLYTRCGDWNKAVVTQGKLYERNPSSHSAFLCYGSVLAMTGNMEGYCRLCQDCLNRLGETKDAYIAHWLVRTCIIKPCANLNLEILKRLAALQMADAKSSFLPDNQFCRGVVEYRSKAYAACIATVEPTLSMRPLDDADPYRHAASEAVIAMAHFQMGQTNEARAALAEEKQIVAGLPELGRDDLTGHWAFWVLMDCLHREATVLIEPGKKEMAKIDE
jgi:tetratricopeptide (TPR) repeat protein